jgi:hypothetical protein
MSFEVQSQRMQKELLANNGGFGWRIRRHGQLQSHISASPKKLDGFRDASVYGCGRWSFTIPGHRPPYYYRRHHPPPKFGGYGPRTFIENRKENKK